MANQKGYGVRGIQRIATALIQPGATFNAGDFIVKTNTGAVIAAAAGANWTAGNGLFYGRALNGTAADPTAFNGAAPTSVQFIVAEPGTEFEVPLYPASTVPAIGQIATSYELRNVAVGYPAVDTSQTTNVAVRVIEPCAKDCASWDTGSFTSGVAGASVWVEFIGSTCALTGAR